MSFLIDQPVWIRASADGEGGYHDGEVGLDGVAFVVLDRPGS
jgi:hypothetical protein